MDGSKIEQIIDDWGKYLQSKEYGREMRFFEMQLPESLLPHPKEEIEEALNIYIKHFEKIGKQELAQPYLNSMAILSTFVSDEQAINNLSQNKSFEDPKTKDIKRILIVEDSRILAEQLSEILSNEGFIVKIAYDGEEALKEIPRTHFDFVYLGIMMPKLNGLDVLRIIKDEKIKVGPIVVFSALVVKKDLCIQLGAKGFENLDNISPSDVVNKIKNYLQDYDPSKEWANTSSNPAIDLVEVRISDVHKVFYELLSIHGSDPIQHRKAVEKGMEEVLGNRTGWIRVAPGHFTYTNGMNIFIDPVTPPSTWGLISEIAKRVLQIELEEIIPITSKDKATEIQKAIDKLINERDWTITFIRKRI